AELTGAARVGLQDNFFHLGGHSLMAVRLASHVRASLGRELPIQTLFSCPVIGDLASALERVAKTAGSEPALLPDATNLHRPFPLTPVQEAYWIGRQNIVALGNVACHSYVELQLTVLDVERFAQAWQAVIARHPMLRVAIREDGSQHLLEKTPQFAVAFADLSRKPHMEALAHAGETRRRMSHQVLPADRAPLLEVGVTRVAAGDWRIHLSMDALILDGESSNIMLQEVFDLYAGRELAAGPALSFRDYVLNRAACGRAHEVATQYWQGRIASLPAAPALPLAAEPARVAAARFARRSVRLPHATWAALKSHAMAAGVTPSILLLTAYAEVIATWSADDDFTLNLTLADRPQEFSGVLGVFTNLVPLEVRAGRTGSFAHRARALSRQLAADLDHRACSGIDVQRLIARAQGDPQAGLLPVVFTSVLGESQLALPDGAEVTHAITQTPQTWLDNKVYEDGRADRLELCIDWDAPDGLFPEGVLDAMFAAYEGLLTALADPQEWSGRTRSLVPAEHLAVFAAANTTAAPLPVGLLHEGVFDAAARTPEAPALLGAGTLTFGALAQRACALARALDASLGAEDRLVAIVMEKGPEQIVAALALLETGRAFLPISAGQPDQRIARILRQSGARVAITQARIRRGRAWQAAVRLVDAPETEAREPAARLSRAGSPGDLAYVIYTSGSTGDPKGVAVTHRAACNTLADLTRRLAIAAHDRVLWVSSFEFDLSIFDIFAVLAAGGAVVVPAPDGAQNPAAWADAVREYRVTLWNSVPALAELMLAAAENPARDLASLRLVLLSGDWIPLALPSRLRAVLAAAARIISLGGATEAAIWSILHEIHSIDPSWASIPYGLPLANQRWHVLKPDLTPCPLHTAGRLYIAGDGLALGYWHNEAETTARFITHPVTGERLYDTGDLGRYRAGGVIEFLGRTDTQVKLRGFRIELGEIEAQINAHPHVRGAAAMVAAQTNGRQIVAYVVCDLGSLDELRSWLEARLPDYMVPAALVALDAIPLTANGKVDRAALARLRPTVPSDYSAPATEKEKRLCALVAALLGVGRVGLTDNYFHLGGDSIGAIRLVNIARSQGWRIEPRDVFAHPVMRDLAARLVAAATDEDEDTPFFPEATISRLRQQHSDIEDVWPLTPLQEGLWFHAQYDGDGEDPYLVQLALELEGPLHVVRLRKALEGLLARHASLRISLHQDDQGHPLQVVQRTCQLPWAEHDLMALDPEERAARALEIERDDRRRRIALDCAPLMRATLLKLSPGHHRLLLAQHHLLGDGWSTTVFFRDLLALYRANGEPAALPPAARFEAYLRWCSRQDEAAALQAWSAHLRGFAGPTLIAPHDRRDLAPRQAQLEMDLTAELSARLETFVRQQGLTPATVLQGAWALMLGSLLNRDDVCFGAVASGRQAPVPGIVDMLGLLITTTPVRVHLSPAQPVGEMLRRLQSEQIELMAQQYLPLPRIHRQLGVAALFDTLFTYENYPVEPPPPRSPDELPLTDVRGHNSNHYPLSVAVVPGNPPRLRLHFNGNVFGADDVRRFAGMLVRFAEQIVADPQ
ncbi:MAG TPA: amino acid adenylation domain-containing protein, partial [Steroidobacteraceae bacterium]|nr:amino acid adenylation domain-containing protein [Steroidobacteraceae bacterium]